GGGAGGGLSFLNPRGAAVGSRGAGLWALGALGEAGSVRLAAGTNFAVGLVVLAGGLREKSR
ncbi:MAG: hypothetical protein ACK44W_15310, partial [Planctomycetota bacterium]